MSDAPNQVTLTIDGVEVSGPVLVGPRCRIAPGARLTGPAVIGAGCEIGEGSTVKEAVLLDGVEMSAGSYVAGGVLGRQTS